MAGDHRRPHSGTKPLGPGTRELVSAILAALDFEGGERNMSTVAGALRSLDSIGSHATDADARTIAGMITDHVILTAPVPLDDPPDMMPAPVRGARAAWCILRSVRATVPL